jgi:pyridoxal phosphate enzyme (YggS family)
MKNIAHTYTSIRQQLTVACQRASRSPNDVLLLAASKTQSPTVIKALYELGQHDFGENRLQEALPKLLALSALPLTWHFIGPLQTNKIARIAHHFDWVHSICRLQEAQKLHEHRTNKPPLQVCLQVNVGLEPQKQGLLPDISVILPLAETIKSELTNLTLRGLMTILPAHIPPETQLTYFKTLQTLQHHLQSRGFLCDTLSMGMSDDFETAIQAGSTCVRIGRRLFGESK